MNTAQEEQNLTLVDGVYYNEDGEAVDTELQSEAPEASMVEWVMERILNLDADLARHDIKAKAVTDNLASQRKEIENRRAGLLYRFGNMLEDFAGRELTGKKTKTLKTPFGKLSFRTKPASLEWDKENLLPWAKKAAPDAIKVTESVLVSQLSEGQKTAAIIAGVATEKPEEEVFKIDTGVGK